MIVVTLFSGDIVPVIGPDNVLPGSWFTTNQDENRSAENAEREANRQYHCAVRESRTGLTC